MIPVNAYQSPVAVSWGHWMDMPPVLANGFLHIQRESVGDKGGSSIKISLFFVLSHWSFSHFYLLLLLHAVALNIHIYIDI